MRRFLNPVFIVEGRHDLICGNIACSFGTCHASPETVPESSRIPIRLQYRSARISVTVGVSYGLCCETRPERLTARVFI
jgi:hypothetical protein